MLLILVMMPGIGREVNGATRWIPLGFFTLQGSEFVKLFAVVFLASYLASPTARYQERLSAYLLPLGLTGLLVGMLLLQPDFGACVVLMSAVLADIFLSVSFRRSWSWKIKHFTKKWHTYIVRLNLLGIPRSW